MDVQRNTRGHSFSILNDNNSPSFTFKQSQKSTLPSPSPNTIRLPSITSLTAHLPASPRPNLLRHPQFYRQHSVSSVGSPPLLRFDSFSSSKSGDSMASTPSPITPASSLAQYENLLQQNPALAYLPSPTGITPFMDQSMMLAPIPQEAFHPKQQPLAPATYPSLPISSDMIQLPTPAPSAVTSVSSNSSATQPVAANSQSNNASTTQKKNKYPCPYAQSHNCLATFTTSGHAARHGKKHTGEKGVHCPICDKAFTRKDNMKQHERTHKNRPANNDEKKSKAQTTRDASRVKEDEAQDQITTQQLPPHPAQIRKSNSGQSEPSDLTMLSNPIQTPDNLNSAFFPDPNPQIIMPIDAPLLPDTSAASLYPQLMDDPLVAAALGPTEKLELPVPQAPVLVRGFSDLDTLAHAAASETYDDPYFPQQQQF